MASNGTVGTDSDLIGYFSAGPSKLPHDVMVKAQKEFIEYKNTHVSVMELSHRTADYIAINDEAIARVKSLLNVPDNYKIMFFQGGGQGQFAGVPLNLMKEGGSVDYFVNGSWSEKAIKEAKKYGTAKNVNPIKEYTSIPPEDQWSRDPNADYLYYCDNETINGIEFPFIPSSEGQFANVPIVADMSSNFMSRNFDITKFGCIFAAAQKNIGPAGNTLVICREDLIGKAKTICPTILDYSQMAKNNSILNTPVTYSLYMTNLVLGWIQENGGLDAMEADTKRKSKLLYDIIDSSNGFYTSNVSPDCRSKCNVVFRVKGGDEALEAEFLSAAKKANLLSLKGHRSVGGLRASLYNAVTYEVVEKLAGFMKEFQAGHGM